MIIQKEKGLSMYFICFHLSLGIPLSSPWYSQFDLYVGSVSLHFPPIQSVQSAMFTGYSRLLLQKTKVIAHQGLPKENAPITLNSCTIPKDGLVMFSTPCTPRSLLLKWRFPKVMWVELPPPSQTMSCGDLGIPHDLRNPQVTVNLRSLARD